MLSGERKAAIAAMIERDGSVTVSQLMDTFNISIETVRRDLSALESEKLLRRVHGGAVSMRGFRKLGHIDQRINENVGAKKELAAAAVKFISENDIISIESGSTSMELAKLIRDSFKKLTVVTNSLDVFSILSENPDIKLILLGGDFYRKERCFCGSLAVKNLLELHVSKAFLCPYTVSETAGICTGFENFVEMEKAFISSADKLFFLADSSKFGQTSLYTVCELDKSMTFVTDNGIPKLMCDSFTEKGIKVVRANA